MIFQRLPIAVNNSDLPVLTISNIAGFPAYYDVNSAGHWLFAQNNSLADPFFKKNLIANTPPVFSSSYITTAPNLIDKFINVGLIDTSYTLTTVCRLNANVSTGLGYLIGNLATLNGAGLFFNTSRQAYITARGTVLSSSMIGSPLALNTWYFIGLSVDRASNTTNAIIGSIGTSSTIAPAAGDTVGIGNGYATTTTANNNVLDIAEIIAYQQAMPDLAVLYTAAKARLSTYASITVA